MSFPGAAWTSEGLNSGWKDRTVDTVRDSGGSSMTNLHRWVRGCCPEQDIRAVYLRNSFCPFPQLRRPTPPRSLVAGSLFWGRFHMEWPPNFCEVDGTSEMSRAFYN